MGRDTDPRLLAALTSLLSLARELRVLPTVLSARVAPRLICDTEGTTRLDDGTLARVEIVLPRRGTTSDGLPVADGTRDRLTDSARDCLTPWDRRVPALPRFELDTEGLDTADLKVGTRAGADARVKPDGERPLLTPLARLLAAPRDWPHPTEEVVASKMAAKTPRCFPPSTRMILLLQPGLLVPTLEK